MSKTPFSNQCDILGNLWLGWAFADDNPKGWDEFFAKHKVGMPLALAIHDGIATVKDTSLVEDAWKDLCYVFGVDYNDLYTDIENFFWHIEESTNAKG